MKKLSFFIVLCLTMALFNVNNIRAQETEEPTLFLIMEEFVAPSDRAEFWKVQSEALKIFDELKFDMTFFAYQTDDNSFYWAIPLKSFASIDELFAKMMSNHKLLKEKGYDPAEKFRDLSTISHFVVSGNKELSYHPVEKPDGTEPEKFYEWTYFHLKSGHEKEAAEAVKKYMEFYDSIEENYEWNGYDVVLGNNTPCWILEVSAESELALRMLNSDLQKKYGKDLQKLWQNFIQHVGSTETKKGWYLPDWSRYPKE